MLFKNPSMISSSELSSHIQKTGRSKQSRIKNVGFPKLLPVIIQQAIVDARAYKGQSQSSAIRDRAIRAKPSFRGPHQSSHSTTPTFLRFVVLSHNFLKFQRNSPSVKWLISAWLSFKMTCDKYSNHRFSEGGSI